MNWDSTKIFNKVTEAADKYGSSNPQQRKQLLFSLAKCDGQEIYDGLLNIFKSGHDNYSERQELAGWLLFKIIPNASFNTERDLKSCLNNYELSVEQLPYFYINKLGKSAFSVILDNIRGGKLSDKESEALETIEFWTRNYEKFSKQNG